MLGALVFDNEDEREKLEGILHPLVCIAQDAFVKEQRSAGHKIVALDIPLLFETGAEVRCDYTVNISAPEFVQQARVLSRPGMDEKKLGAILKRQMPDGEKCVRADFIVHSGLGRAQMMKELKGILYIIENGQSEEEIEAI